MSHMVTFHSGEWHRKIHMSTWSCDVGHEAVLQFKDYESLVRHVRDPANYKDRRAPTDLQLDTLSSDKQRFLVRDEEYCCPLCECASDTLEPYGLGEARPHPGLLRSDPASARPVTLRRW